jgi:hypothetical protein
MTDRQRISPLIARVLRGWMLVYIFSFQFISALGINVWLPLYFVVAAGSILAFGIYFGRSLERSDIWLGVTLISGFIAVMASPYAGRQNFLYSAAWSVVFIIEFAWVRDWLSLSEVREIQIARAAAITLLSLSFAVALEFTMANTKGLYLSDFIPFNFTEFPPALIFDRYERPRGFAMEAGFTAIVFEALFPLAVFAFRGRTVRLLLFCSLVVPCYLLLASGASLLSAMAGVGIFLMTGKGPRWIRFGIAAAFGLIIVMCIFSAEMQDIFYQIIGRKVDELFFAARSYDEDEMMGRRAVYSMGLNMLLENPMGVGWGMLSQMYRTGGLVAGADVVVTRGFISLPLEVFVCTGFIGGIAFSIFLVRKNLALLKFRKGFGANASIALLAVTIHHFAVLEFWMPMLWFLLALSDHLTARRTTSRKVPQSALPRLPLKGARLVNINSA